MDGFSAVAGVKGDSFWPSMLARWEDGGGIVLRKDESCYVYDRFIVF